MTESLPKRIGPWRIEAEIGRGMMGLVYKARDARRRVAALKVVRILFPVSDEERVRFEKRFIQEGRIVARLAHQGIVGVYDVGRDKRSRVSYMALEYLEGRTLAAFLAEGPALTWREALAVVAQVARALDYAHGQGVIHRDIKPANIMVLPSGRAKIMDFGLAKHEAGGELTSTGQFMGTPLYMSPEQALGERVDSRADLFSLGSVAYTLLTGKRAFEADSVPQVMNRVAQATPRAPTRVASTLPPAVDYVIARSMAKRRADRYPTGGMFADDVEDILEGRSPRHSAGWTWPTATEGTLVTTRDPRWDPEEHDEELELQPLEEPRRGVTALVGLGLALVVLTAIVARSPFWQERLAEFVAPKEVLGPAFSPRLSFPSAPPTTSPEASSPPGASPSPEETPAPEPAGDLTPPDVAGAPGEDEVLVDEAPVEPSPSPSGEASESPASPPTTAPPVEELTEAPRQATPAPSQTPETASGGPPPSAAPRPQPATARLSISFEHGIESGTLRILVDKKAVLQHRLTSRVTRDLLLFKLRSGVVRDTLPVAPGRRRIRVEVRTEDEVRTKETIASFRPGVTRRLQVKIGRLRGNLSIAWK